MFSSDHISQAASGAVSTWMGDRLGTPRTVDIFFSFSFHLLSSLKILLRHCLYIFLNKILQRVMYFHKKLRFSIVNKIIKYNNNIIF